VLAGREPDAETALDEEEHRGAGFVSLPGLPGLTRRMHAPLDLDVAGAAQVPLGQEVADEPAPAALGIERRVADQPLTLAHVLVLATTELLRTMPVVAPGRLEPQPEQPVVQRRRGAVDTLAGMATPASDAAPDSGQVLGSPKAMAAASRLLAGIGSRFEHTWAVARQAERSRHLLPPPWRDALVDAAWLHDVGYAPEISSYAFHPLDGACFLASEGWPGEVCRLVAWHTRAGTEAALRGLTPELEELFRPPPARAQAVLAWADLTSTPEGGRCTAAERLAEILERYPADSVVARATVANHDALLEDAALVESALAGVEELV
jgi:hypothetical protein